MNKKLNKKLNKFRLKRLVLLVFALTGFVLQAEAASKYWAKMNVFAGSAGGGTVYVEDDDHNHVQTHSKYADSAEENVTFSLGTNPTNGYRFIGWYDNSDCTGTALSNAGTVKASKKKGEDNATENNRYAKFTANNYYAKMTAKASGISGGGTVKVGNASAGATSTATHNTPANPDGNTSFTLTASANSGYYFVGWYSNEACTQLVSTDPSFTTTEYTSTTSGATQSYNCYARFLLTGDVNGDQNLTNLSGKNIIGSTLTDDRTWTLAGDNTISGTINLNNHKLTIEIVNSASGNCKLTNTGTGLYNLFITGTGTLTITGKNGKRIIIDGGAVWERDPNPSTFHKHIETYCGRGSINTNGKKLRGAMIRCPNGGSINLKYVTLQNADNSLDGGYAGGAFNTGTDAKSIILNNVIIKNCNSRSYGGGGMINKRNGQSTSPQFNNCEISSCSSVKGGGGIYCEDSLKMSGVKIDSCVSQSRGGGLNIYNVGSKKMVTLNNCTISYCASDSLAGGLEVEGGSCELKGETEISHNIAFVKGVGGVLVGGGCTFTISDNSVKISYNESHTIYLDSTSLKTNDMGGGGICIGKNSSENVFVFEAGEISNNYSEGHGGGIYMRDSKTGTGGDNSLRITGGIIKNNTANLKGGGIYTNGSVTVEGGTIESDTAYLAGGGIYMGSSSTEFNMTGGTIKENIAISDSGKANCNGGGVYIEGNNTTEFPVTITGGTFSGNKATGNGGGFYVGGSESKVEVSNGVQITGNKAKNGAGFYCAGGLLTVKDATTQINQNKASDCGGGFYVGGSKSIVEVSNGVQITCDTAANGAGFYCAGGSLTVSGTSTKINNNVASGNGGGFYGASKITVGEATISGNKAGNGGGFYVNGQDTTTIAIQNGSVISGNTVSQDGAGAYIANGKLTVSNSTTKGNTATRNGGGFFVNNGTFNLTGGTIGSSGEGNHAVNGGGVYVASGSTAAFSNGSITSNRAVEGAGAYIATGGTMSMSGSSSITGNETTSLSGHGAGIYQGGTFNVSGSSLQVTNNLLKGTAKDTGVPNNVYLPSTSKYITIVDPGLSGSAEVGITIPDFPAPVIYSDNQANLQTQYQAFQSGTSQLKDDRNICQAIYDSDATGGTQYNPNYIYFIGTWQGYVHSLGIDTSSYSSESFSTIDSPEKLAIYMSYVNGVNGFAKHPKANGTMSADVDMSEYLWIPIGTSCTSGTEGAETLPYTGTFDGKGHVIRGLNVNGLVGYANYGLFGDVAGGTVKDVFLTDCDFSSYGECTMGTLVGQLNGGTVMNAEGAGKLGVSNSNSTLGGLVGAMTNNAHIVNGMAMCDMTGTKMGGLAGTVASGSSIENSFSNAKFTYSGTAGSHTGGIAADNAGTVTNCYSRLRGTAPSNYGSLVGSNSGTVSNSYAQTSKYIDINSGNADIGLGTFGPTVTPYGYGQAEDGDNKVGDTPLCDKLNGNLAEGYAQWMRTSASPINGDYPILKLGYESVGSEDGIVLQYGTLDENFQRYTNGTTLLYAAAESNEAQPEGQTLYIDEDATLLQNNPAPMKAYAGVTFDNSGKTISSYDWHMFSSPLKDAPVAINYTDNEQVGYGHDIHPVQYAFYPESKYDGYFPSDTPYGDYDFYSFDEYSCHWINFKRNSNSHWHEDGEHAQINYTNEKYLVPGKGYLMALSKETYMQSHGTLNDDDVKVNVTVSAPEGYSAGYNLLGNPYQSYLDFDAFAEANSDLWNEGTAGSYLILDADKSGYISYVIGGSEGGEYAPRYLHPHQGFYLKADNAKEETIFTNAMRRLAGTEPSYFRGTGWSGQRNCPLVNLYATDSDGKREIVVVELEREEQSGARKMKAVVNGECRMYASAAGEDYSVLFAKGHVTEVPVRFEAFSEGEFTLTWNTHNAEFSYLHLIDNITGADYDCLSNDSYTFTASPNDYASRFKLRFEYTAEEPAKVEGNDVFSYQRDGELVVCGTGYMQLIDLQGRVLYSTRLADEVNVLAKPSVSAGLYLIQLAGEDGLKVQKIVIQ